MKTVAVHTHPTDPPIHIEGEDLKCFVNVQDRVLHVSKPGTGKREDVAVFVDWLGYTINDAQGEI